VTLRNLPIICISVLAICSNLPVVLAGEAPITIKVEANGKPISQELVGIFFEDLSYAADGGLYAELVQNRSFEYSAAEGKNWHSLTSWELSERDGGKGLLLVDGSQPLHPNNPHYAVLGVQTNQGAVGLRNAGFDGIPLKAGETYNLSLFARQLAARNGPLTVRLEDKNGQTLDEAKLPVVTEVWKKYTATLTPSSTTAEGRLVVEASHPGRIGLDEISLFPAKTFKGRTNGLRADLAQTIADLAPKFVRFPGGCLVHGDGLDNMYRWKDTIGPVEQRKGQRNIWNYHQSVGLGYFEYFQFCEDIAAEPLPVVAAGVSCQNSGASVTRKYGMGQKGLAMEDMPAYIQDVLDLIEYANGPATSEWGSKRAAAGHPAPFNLKYLGVGNEDQISPEFIERFKMINAAVRAKYPEICVIGTVGPNPDGKDYESGWKLADELRLKMVDEHCYKDPQWFWSNLQRWDGYDRQRSRVYLGEWAAHDKGRLSTLRAALAEAAYLTSMERNGDVVAMASYAPLLAKKGHTHWSPNLIYFSNTDIVPTISYYVQQLFSLYSGDIYLPTSIKGAGIPPDLAVSVVRQSKKGEFVIKLVNGGAEARDIKFDVSSLQVAPTAQTVVLTAPDPSVCNDFANPNAVVPQKSTLAAKPELNYRAPAYSLTIIQLSGR
jgi:alpha-L-arabinofuranosidase